MDTKEARNKIRDMLCKQKLAVLATRSSDFPYTSLIVFWAADLNYIFFATSKNTRKFSYMSQNSMVSLLIDDRQSNDNFFRASAITAIGEAEVIQKKGEHVARFLEKNPQLKDFLALYSTAFIKVRAIKYYLVTEFSQVYQISV